MIAGLPYDAEVEYLESTGTQWIDTGVNISDNDFVLSCDMRSTSRGQSATWSRYFGSYVSETATCTRIINYSRNDNYLYGAYRARANAQTQLTGLGDYTERKVYVLSYGRLDVIHNGTTQSKSLSTTLGTEDTSTVCLFGAKMACYGFQITHSGSLIIDFIPVRFTNSNGQSEGAMYDRVSRKLFRNAGTGAFVIGPDVATPVMGLHFMPKPSPYDAKVEYLESTGTQTIDTGVVIDDNYYVLRCDMCSATLGQSVPWATYFGSYNGEPAKSTRLINNDTKPNSMYCGYMRRSNRQTYISGNFFVAQDRFQYTLEYMKMTIVRPGFNDWIMALPAPEGIPDTSTVKLFSGSCMRCWGFRITHAGVTVIDLTPVRFTNELGQAEGAMYDNVSKQLFRNQGTGAFLWAEKQ